jgi:hypothetical protein
MKTEDVRTFLEFALYIHVTWKEQHNLARVNIFETDEREVFLEINPFDQIAVNKLMHSVLED